MRYALARSTQLALAFVILGLGYVGMLVVLLSANWAGSLTNLWRDVRYASSTYVLIAAGIVANFLVAAMIYQRLRTIRAIGAFAALALFVVSCIGAIQIIALWRTGRLPDAVQPETVWVKPIGALIYGWLAFEAVRVARASNNRWRGP